MIEKGTSRLGRRLDEYLWGRLLRLDNNGTNTERGTDVTSLLGNGALIEARLGCSNLAGHGNIEALIGRLNRDMALAPNVTVLYEKYRIRNQNKTKKNQYNVNSKLV